MAHTKNTFSTVVHAHTVSVHLHLDTVCIIS